MGGLSQLWRPSRNLFRAPLVAVSHYGKHAIRKLSGGDFIGLVRSWQDAHMCVEAHKEHAPVPAGLEDAEYEFVDGDDDEEELNAGSAAASTHGVEAASGFPQPMLEDGQVSSAHASNQVAVPTDDEYMEALSVCAQKAAAACDASFLKQVLKRQWQSGSKRKADATPAGEALRKQIADEHVAEVARRKQEFEDLQKLKIAATLSEAKLAEARAKEH